MNSPKISMLWGLLVISLSVHANGQICRLSKIDGFESEYQAAHQRVGENTADLASLKIYISTRDNSIYVHSNFLSASGLTKAEATQAAVEFGRERGFDATFDDLFVEVNGEVRWSNPTKIATDQDVSLDALLKNIIGHEDVFANFQIYEKAVVEDVQYFVDESVFEHKTFSKLDFVGAKNVFLVKRPHASDRRQQILSRLNRESWSRGFGVPMTKHALPPPVQRLAFVKEKSESLGPDKILRLTGVDQRHIDESTRYAKAIGVDFVSVTSGTQLKMNENAILVPASRLKDLEQVTKAISAVDLELRQPFLVALSRFSNVSKDSLTKVRNQFKQLKNRVEITPKFDYKGEPTFRGDGDAKIDPANLSGKTVVVKLKGIADSNEQNTLRLMQKLQETNAALRAEGMPLARIIYDSGKTGSEGRLRGIYSFRSGYIVCDKKSLDSVESGASAVRLLDNIELGSGSLRFRVLLSHHVADPEAGLSGIASWLTGLNDGHGVGERLIIGICPQNPTKLLQIKDLALEKGFESVTFPVSVGKDGAETIHIPEFTLAMRLLKMEPELLEIGTPDEVVRSAYARLGQVLEEALKLPEPQRKAFFEGKFCDPGQEAELDSMFPAGMSNGVIRDLLDPDFGIPQDAQQFNDSHVFNVRKSHFQEAGILDPVLLSLAA